MSKKGGELLYPLTKQNMEPSVACMLKFLAMEEKDDLQAYTFLPRPTNNWDQFRKWLKQSGKLESIYSQALSHPSAPCTDEEVRRFMSFFVGSVYQNIAHIFLARRCFSGRVLLSPNRTLEFFRHLFPVASVINNPFGMNSFKEIPVPDGILVEETEGHPSILGVCEYTLRGGNRYFGKKYKAFRSCQRRRPRVFDHASLVFVLPRSDYKPKMVNPKTGVRLRRMPFDHKEFRHFIGEILEQSKR